LQRNVLKHSKILLGNLGQTRAKNGEIIAESGAYEPEEGYQKGIALVKDNAANAVVKDCNLETCTFSFLAL
jgi:uncharacterized protein YegP (UPF0339 family)